MKSFFITLTVILMSLPWQNTTAQTYPENPLTKGEAPAFKASSTNGEINFPGDFYGKWKILFSHPGDFTPVCTTEIMALADLQEEFKKLNTALIVLSTDGLNSHVSWINSMESLERKDLPKVKIDFPIISDSDLGISKKYGIINANSIKITDIRAVFFINPENQIKAMFYYPDYVGRNIPEILRTLEALQLNDKQNVLTPANWKPGDDVLLPSPKSIEESRKLAAKNDPKLYQLAWYLWYRKL